MWVALLNTRGNGLINGRILLRPFGIAKDGTATSSRRGITSGVVTGIRALVVLALQRVLKAVMMSGYKFGLCGSEQSRAYRTDLSFDAMVQFKAEPAMRFVRNRANALIVNVLAIRSWQ